MANSKQKKSSGFGTFINVFGSIIMAAMLIIMGVNFYRDARVFQKPVLTKANSTSKTTGSDGYKTIQYKKPSTGDSSSSDKKPSTDKSGTKSQTTTQPASTAKDSGSTGNASTGTIPGP